MRKTAKLALMTGIGLILCASGTLFARDYSWEFNGPEDLAGWTLDGLTGKEVSQGALKATATRGNPMIFTPRVEIDTASQCSVIFSMKLGKGLRPKDVCSSSLRKRPNGTIRPWCSSIATQTESCMNMKWI